MANYRYIIRDTTLYIRPILTNQQLKSEVKEFDRAPFIIDQKPIGIIEQSCHFYNTTYTARKETTRIIADISHKPPIVIKPETATYFFPTHSDRAEESHWLNLAMIRQYNKGYYNDTIITFEDDSRLTFPVSYHIINTQYLHAVKLEYCLRTKSVRSERERAGIDYKKANLNIYEVLAMYALLEKQV